MSTFERMQSTQISTTTAVLCIAALLCVSGGVIFAVQRFAMRGPAPERAATTRVRPPVGRAPVVPPAATPAAPALPDPSPASPAGTAYGVISERNLFQPLYPPPPAATESTPPPVVLPAELPPPPPPRSRNAPPDPSRNIAFTGVVTTPEGTSALLENLTTKETVYVGTSESAFGFYVEYVTPAAIGLSQDGTSVTLALGENKPEERPAPAASGEGGATPATSSAGGNARATATPRTAQPGSTARSSRENPTPEQLERLQQYQQRRSRTTGTTGERRTSP